MVVPLIRQGYMPNLGKLLAEGLSAELESVTPPVTAPAWVSFMTGKQPGKHGIFDFTRFDIASGGWKINNAQHVRAKTIWQILSEHDKRVVVLNLPYTYPAYKVNGALVAGWDAPSTATFTYPAELGSKVSQLIPDYTSTLDLSMWNYMPAQADDDFNRFVGKLIKSCENSTRLASGFLGEEEWDAFMVHFQQTDWIQHKLWGLIDRAVREPNNKTHRVEQVRACYRQFDECVGRLLAEVASFDPMVVILSDHGFGPLRGSICPNYFLTQWGYFRLRDDKENPLKRAFKQSRHAGLRKLYRRLATAKKSFQGRRAAKSFTSWADMISDTVPRQRFPVDWSRTRVAAVAGSENAFLYVNVKDRSPLGIVQPGAEYEAILEDLIQQFRGVYHPKTGERLFKNVARGREIYPQAADGVLLPDLVLVSADGYVCSTANVEGFLPETGEEGNHRHNGVLFLQGKGLKKEARHFHPNLIDLAPTILHAVGLAVPADMDGRVLQEVFTDPQEVRYEDVDNSMDQQATDYTEEEAELIEQRLKGLGYIE